MAQVESAANLHRWEDPACRLITVILVRCGLPISSARTLAFDCLLHDAQGAPYRRYVNTKMRREAAVPIDEELETEIRSQQCRVHNAGPTAARICSPDHTPTPWVPRRSATAPTGVGSAGGCGRARCTTNTVVRST